MTAQKINTILLITRDRLVRADLGAQRRGGGMALAEERRPAVDDLPSLVEAALRLSTRRPGRVWVLSSDLWTQTLTLPPESIAGLRPEEIQRALGFEVEPFSGIPALEAVVAAVALPDRDQHSSVWLTELSASQLEQIEYVVTQAGGRLAGISHPAGLPRPLPAYGPIEESPGNDAQRDGWQRVELWPGTIVGVQGAPGRRTTVFVRNSDPKPDQWEADVERWQAAQPQAGLVQGLHATDGVALDGSHHARWISLGAPAGQEAFFQAWAEHLGSRDLSLPAILPPKRPMSVTVRRALAGALALVAIVLCAGLQTAMEYRRNDRIAETARLRAPAEQLKALKAETGKLQTRQAELSKTCQKLTADLAHYQQVMQSQRQRLAALMTVLAQRSGEMVVIRKIDGTGNEIILSGICLRPEPASLLAGALATALKPHGWQVEPPSKQSREMLVDGGPWTFEVRITDPEPTATPSPAGGRSP